MYVRNHTNKIREGDVLKNLITLAAIVCLVAACGDDLKKNGKASNNISTTNGQTTGATNNDIVADNNVVMVENNSTTNNCMSPTMTMGGPKSYVALITDTSFGDACLTTDLGSDFVGILLQIIEGTILGYGELAYDNVNYENNDFSGAYNLDDTSVNKCPEFDELSITALGCGESVGVRFLDIDDVPVALEPSYQIQVLEYGTQCGGGSDDTADVSVCSDTNAVINDYDISSCEVIGDGSGISTILI